MVFMNNGGKQRMDQRDDSDGSSLALEIPPNPRGRLLILLAPGMSRINHAFSHNLVNQLSPWLMVTTGQTHMRRPIKASKVCASD